MFGRKASDESKRKMSESHLKEKHYRYIKFTDEQLLEKLKLKNDGLSYEKIALIFSVSPTTVKNRIIELKNKKEEETICKEEVAI